MVVSSNAVSTIIKQHCVSCKCTYGDIARRLQVSEPTVKAWITGTRKPRLKNLRKLATAANVKFSSLLQHKDPEWIEALSSINSVMSIYKTLSKHDTVAALAFLQYISCIVVNKFTANNIQVSSGMGVDYVPFVTFKVPELAQWSVTVGTMGTDVVLALTSPEHAIKAGPATDKRLREFIKHVKTYYLQKVGEIQHG